jgi:capsule biosynthesis phosphatase
MNDPKKTVVFDVDDTVLFTENRDYSNSRPNGDVVKGMRELKQAGWRIILQTARGMGRSGNNIEMVREDVMNEIVNSCTKHNIPYDEIILGKPWATWYVDDKALTPEEFVKKYAEVL